MIGYLITASGLGGLVFLNEFLVWYAAHAYWFLGSAVLFLVIAGYISLVKYPSRKNRILMVVNVIAVAGLFVYYWI